MVDSVHLNSLPQNTESLPIEQTAIVADQDGTLTIVNNAPVPDLKDDMVLVRTMAAALNPVDAKMIGSLATPGAIAGMDFAGQVVAIGAKVKTARQLQVGDRVCGSVQGMHSLTPTIGAFSQYVGACDLVTLKLPTWMSYEEGASFGVGIGTAILALFRSLGLPGSPREPAAKAHNVLVYGGSTATGTLAMQLLRLAGHIPIATCSPHNFELVTSYGAEAVFDYRAETAIADIRAHTRNSLRYVLDCISEPDTMRFSYACIGRTGGRYTAVEPFLHALHTRPTVTPDWVLGPAILGKTCCWPEPFSLDANEGIRSWTAQWFAMIQDLVMDGRLRPHRISVVSQGFDAVLLGLEKLRRKQVSGEKIVCTLA